MFRKVSRIVVFAAMAAAACSSPMADDRGLPEGSFVLQKVNGVAVPYPMVDNGSMRVDVVARSVELRSDGSFTDHLELRVADGAGLSPLTTRRSGTFTSDHGWIVLTYGDTGRTSVAALDGLFLELDDRGVAFLLHR